MVQCCNESCRKKIVMRTSQEPAPMGGQSAKLRHDMRELASLPATLAIAAIDAVPDTDDVFAGS